MTLLTRRFDDALLYASHIHGGHLRKGTSIPYLSHLLSVAALTMEHGGDEDQAIGALLHDAAEDCGGEAQPREAHEMAALDRIVGTWAGDELMPGAPSAADEVDQVLILAGRLRIGCGIDKPELNAAALQSNRVVDEDWLAEEVVLASNPQRLSKPCAVELDAQVMLFDRDFGIEQFERRAERAFIAFDGR